MIKAELRNIIKDCIKLKKPAQYKLYEICFNKFIGTCYRYRQDEELARETLNIAYMKILTNLKKLDIDQKFDVWAKTIIIRTAIDEIRKDKRNVKKMEIAEHSEYITRGTALNTALGKLALEELKLLIEKLPNSNRSVFNLFVIDGYAHKEIADLLNISVASSKWNLHEAKKKLQVMVESMHDIKSNSYG